MTIAAIRTQYHTPMVTPQLQDGAFYAEGCYCVGGAFMLDGNGQNFFTAVASNGEFIKSVQINSQVGLADIAQVRLGQALITTPVVIPEPAAWGLMILGFFGTGAILRNRRRAEAGLGLA